MRTRVTQAVVALAAFLSSAGCNDSAQVDAVDVSDLSGPYVYMEILAADSMEGRRTGTVGTERAARFIELRFREAGLEPAGDSGFYQFIPMSLRRSRSGRARPRLLDDWAAYDLLSPADRVREANIVGILRGSDPDLRDEYVLVTAHYDHLGVGRPVDGDSIYNGADDDASGTAALIWIAEKLAEEERRPARSIVFAAMTGEELGLMGTRWYIAAPVVPLSQTVANLNIEMIARPDTAVGPARAWLTGYDRTTMGAILAAAGLPVVPDPRPGQSYYRRSDNFALARRGIPAHTISSYGGHDEYHTPDDESELTDRGHMEALADVSLRAVSVLANGKTPEWNEGGRP